MGAVLSVLLDGKEPLPTPATKPKLDAALYKVSVSVPGPGGGAKCPSLCWVVLPRTGTWLTALRVSCKRGHLLPCLGCFRGEGGLGSGCGPHRGGMETGHAEVCGSQ